MSAPRIQWLGMLAKLIAPADTLKAFDALRVFDPFLADLPDAAFTTGSLKAVAMAPRRLWLPELREVREPLEAWWRDHQPPRPALPAPVFRPEPERPLPTEEERAAVAKALREHLARMRRAPERVRTVDEQMAALRGDADAASGPPAGSVRTRHAAPEQLAAARAELARKAAGVVR